MYKEIINSDEFEFNSNYPEALEKLIALNLTNFNAWYLISKEQSILIYKNIKKQYDLQKLVPFARRGDNEDIACFERNNIDKVVVINYCDYLGYHKNREFNSVWDWFRDAIEIMISY